MRVYINDPGPSSPSDPGISDRKAQIEEGLIWTVQIDSSGARLGVVSALTGRTSGVTSE